MRNSVRRHGVSLGRKGGRSTRIGNRLRVECLEDRCLMTGGLSFGLDQSPFWGEPSVVPGLIQAEDFDHGGEGVAYHDTNPANEGGHYRYSGVDITYAFDGRDDYLVGWVQAGEWLEYTVDVATTGTYQLIARVASQGIGGTFHVEFGGVDRTGPIEIPDTGDWYNWKNVSKAVTLESGVQVMRIAFDANGSTGFVGNLNWLVLVPELEEDLPLSVLTGGPYTGIEGTPITLYATASDWTQSYVYSWDLNNDGSYETSGQMVSHTFLDDGVYTIGVRIIDALGNTATATTTVTIANVAPTIWPGGPYGVMAGQPLTFNAAVATDPSPIDTAAGFMYYWDFGDGSTGAGKSPTHIYKKAGTYTASVRAVDKDGASSPPAFTIVGVTAAPSHHETIPDFAAEVTIASIASGSWSDPSTWSLGRRPVTGDVVVISEGTTVDFDRVDEERLKSVVIDSGAMLRFRNDIDTRLWVGTLLVDHHGVLEIGTEHNPIAPGVRATLTIANQAIDSHLDPEQFGTGLIGLGRVGIYGAVKDSTYVRLAVEPAAGTTTLVLAEPVSGWRPGDRLILPDTRQIRTGESQIEELILSSVSSDGRTLTLTAPLRFGHQGARDGNGTLDFLPHVGNLTRNVAIVSESPNGTRGHTIFTDRANVDIRYATFRDLGRTHISEPLDSTTFDDMGHVSHFGTNQLGRYPIHVHHLMGPESVPANGHQFTLIGNAIDGGSVKNDVKWGIAIHASHYGLAAGNVVYNVAGGGIVTEDGSESFNRIENNFIVRVAGLGGRADQWAREFGIASEGSGLWLGGPHNFVRNNVVANAQDFGYTFALLTGGAMASMPTTPGDGHELYQRVDLHSLPILEFEGNEVYAGNGLTLWYVGAGTNGAPDLNVAESVIKDLRIWHPDGYGIYFYPSNRITLDGLVIRGDMDQLYGPRGTFGIVSGHYMVPGQVVRNSDIQGLGIGVSFPTTMNGAAPLVLENTYLRNYINVQINTLEGLEPWVQPREIIIRNVRFASPNRPAWEGPMLDIDMDYRLGGRDQPFVSDIIRVENYNGVEGDDFRIYYNEQAAHFIVPQAQGEMHGPPEAGLTNQEAWDRYGYAIAGEVAPKTAVIRPKLKGLVDLL